MEQTHIDWPTLLLGCTQLTKYLTNRIKFLLNVSVFSMLTFMLSPFAYASKEPIKIGSYLSPHLIKADGTGLFNKLNHAVLMEMNKNFELTLTSMNRARMGVKMGSLDTYFPELWENMPTEGEDYVVSRPIFYKQILLFTLKSSGLNQLSDFEDKALGVVRGFSYGREIISHPKLNLTYQDNDMINIRLLLNKRIDGVLGGFPGTVKAVKSTRLAHEVNYDVNKPIAILASFYVCKNDPAGVELCNNIDKAIESLLDKGILELNDVTGYSRFTPPETMSANTALTGALN